MKRFSAGLWALALLSLVSALTPVQAQTAGAIRAAGPFSYDLSQEVTLSGTVSSVLTKPAPGMMMGSHLLLTTISGPVDASLGRFALRGRGAVSITAGQQIEVTGVMKTIKGQQVFLTRTVKASGRVYAIRNEHGVLLSPQSRERASRMTQKGESL